MVRRFVLMTVAAVVLLSPLACGSPNKANIALRKQNQDLSARVVELESLAEQLRSDVRRLEAQTEGPTIPTLPSERLEQMWTVAGLTFGRLTGIDDGAAGRPLKVYLTPVDEGGDALKATGDVTVEAFDLTKSDGLRLGSWTFDAERVKGLWTGGFVGAYALPCPWGDQPFDPPEAGRELVVKVTFVDTLTGRTFEAKRDVKVER